MKKSPPLTCLRDIDVTTGGAYKVTRWVKHLKLELENNTPNEASACPRRWWCCADVSTNVLKQINVNGASKKSNEEELKVMAWCQL